MSLSNADVHAFTSALKGVVMEGVEAALPSSSSAAPVGRVMKLLLLHLRFACRWQETGTCLPSGGRWLKESSGHGAYPLSSIPL